MLAHSSAATLALALAWDRQVCVLLYLSLELVESGTQNVESNPANYWYKQGGNDEHSVISASSQLQSQHSISTLQNVLQLVSTIQHQ